MGLKNNYSIKRISYKEAMEIVVEKHYLHRKSKCSYSFGLFKNDSEEILGVVVYGIPASYTLCKGLCGQEESKNVYELTRLWVDDSVPKNGESFLIGNTIKQLDKEIVVSFADTKESHIGMVYQASNWIYTGLTKKIAYTTIEGLEDKHSRHSFGKHKQKKIAEESENVSFVRKERSQKHRYVYFNAKGKRKRELLSLLKYPTHPYPKQHQSEDARNVS